MRKAIILIILLSLSLTTSAQRRNTRQRQPTQREQLQQRQRQLQQQQQANRKRQQELEQQVKVRMKDVEALGSEIADKQLVIDSLHLAIDTLQGNIAVLDSQLVVLRKELEERRQHFIKSVRYMYRNRNMQNQMIFVLSAKNFNQMYRRMRFMNEYTTHQRAQGEAVKQKGEQVAVKLGELNEARSEAVLTVAAVLHNTGKETCRASFSGKVVPGDLPFASDAVVLEPGESREIDLGGARQATGLRISTGGKGRYNVYVH